MDPTPTPIVFEPIGLLTTDDKDLICSDMRVEQE